MIRIDNITSRFLALDRHDQSLMSQLMFFIPLVTWIAVRLLTRLTSFAAILHGLIDYSVIWPVLLTVLLAREVLFGRWDRKAFLGLAILVFLVTVSERAGVRLLSETAVIVFCGRNVNFRTIALVCFVELSVILISTVTAALLGFIPDVIRDAQRGRHQLGFAHPNTGPCLLFFVLCLWVYLRRERFGIIDAIVSMGVFATLFFLTNSRTSTILAVLLVAMALVMRWIPNTTLDSRPLQLVGASFIAVCALGSIAMAIAFNPENEVMAFLDRLVSGRFNLAHKALEQYGFSLFGQKVNFSDAYYYSVVSNKMVKRSNPGIVVDCTYVRLAIRCGLPYLATVVALATLANIKAIHARQYHLVLVVCMIAVHGISELCCSYVYYNAFLFLLGSLFYQYSIPIGSTPRHGKHARRTPPPGTRRQLPAEHGDGSLATIE